MKWNSAQLQRMWAIDQASSPITGTRKGIAIRLPVIHAAVRVEPRHKGWAVIRNGSPRALFIVPTRGRAITKARHVAAGLGSIAIIEKSGLIVPVH